MGPQKTEVAGEHPEGSGVMDRLADLFGRYWVIVALGVIAFTAVCLFGVSRIRFDNDALKLLQSRRVEFKHLGGQFAHLENTCIVVLESDDLLSPPAVEAIRRIVARIDELEGVEAVHSMLSVPRDRRVGRLLLPLFPSSGASPERFERARIAAASHPLLVGHLLSEDIKTTLVLVHFSAEVRGFSEAERVVDRLRSLLLREATGEGLRARLTGIPPLEVEIVENMRDDIFLLSALGGALTIVIAALLFRRLGAAVIVAAAPAVGSIWTVGVLGLIGQPINMLTNVVPVLVLVIGFTDAVHLMLHVRRSLAAGSTRMEATQGAIRRLGLPCALTSLSTAVGFGSLTVASLEGIRLFGQCCALGTLLSFCAVLTTVPLLAISPLGKTVVIPAGARRQSALPACADRMLRIIVSRARVVLIGGTALTLAMVFFAARLEPDHAIATEVPHSSEVYQALTHVDKAFGGVMFAYVVVQWPEDHGLRSEELYEVLEEVHAVLDASATLSNPLSLLNLVKSLPGRGASLAQRAAELRYVPEAALRRFVNGAEREAVVSAHMPDVGARVLKPAFADVERQLADVERRHPGFRLQLTGASVTVFRNIHMMIEDLWKSLATAAGLMFLMICLGLRSLRYALLSVIPNLFPLLCTGTFIVLSGRYLEASSVIVFSISLGIAVDDTIHFLVRFQRELEGGLDRRAAVRRTFQVVGLALVITTVALVAGHSIVRLSAFPAVRTFGLLAAITIASALVGDLVILPALLVCFAKGKTSK